MSVLTCLPTVAADYWSRGSWATCPATARPASLHIDCKIVKDIIANDIVAIYVDNSESNQYLYTLYQMWKALR